MQDRFIDLHLHSIYSDGASSIKEVLSDAQQLGLSAISITDHDSVAGVDEAIHIGRQCGIEVISGIEMSAYHQDVEVHILGYFIDYQNRNFVQLLQSIQHQRKVRINQIVIQLNEIGLMIDIESVLDLVQGNSPGRLHVARALVLKGMVKDVSEAFNRFLGKGKPAYVDKDRLSTLEVIDMIREVGGIVVAAHPVFINDDQILEQMIVEGLNGIEVYHPRHSNKTIDHFFNFSKKWNLIMTGGSDCHGVAKGKKLIGSMQIPYHLLENLKGRLDSNA